MAGIEIYIKLSALPDDMKKEVNDFVDFLKSKTIGKSKSNVKKKGD